MTKCMFVSVVLVFLNISCSGPEKLLSDKSAERIYFGKSGGFTNIPMAYVLIDHTYIFRIDKDNFIPIRKLSRKETVEINRRLDAVNIDNLILDEPGNMTYYIRTAKDIYEKEIKWTDTSTNEQVKELYKALISTVNK